MAKLVCEVCGGDISKTGDTFSCKNCGCEYSLEDVQSLYSHNAETQTAPTGTNEAVAAQVVQRSSTGPVGSQFLFTPRYPFLEKWKTKVGPTICGIIGNIVIEPLLYSLIFLLAKGWIYDSDTGDGLLYVWTVVLALFLLISIAVILYTSFFYPRLYRENPGGLFKSPAVVSFMNGLVGGPIFGPIWNTNLTNRTKGVSHWVLVTLYSIGRFISLFFGILILLRLSVPVVPV